MSSEGLPKEDECFYGNFPYHARKQAKKASHTASDDFSAVIFLNIASSLSALFDFFVFLILLNKPARIVDGSKKVFIN